MKFIPDCTFQVLEFQFTLDEQLSPYLFNIKYESSFRKVNDCYDEIKKNLLMDIMKRIT